MELLLYLARPRALKLIRLGIDGPRLNINFSNASTTLGSGMACLDTHKDPATSRDPDSSGLINGLDLASTLHAEIFDLPSGSPTPRLLVSDMNFSDYGIVSTTSSSGMTGYNPVFNSWHSSSDSAAVYEVSPAYVTTSRAPAQLPLIRLGILNSANEKLFNVSTTSCSGMTGNAQNGFTTSRDPDLNG